MKKTVLALAVLATTSLPVMAESVDVRVIGTITPAACTPSLTGGGTIDYGAINPATLSSTAFTVLPEKQIDFSISCDAPAKVAIKAINGRPNTVAGSTEGPSGTATAPVNVFGTANISVAGLGLDGADKIGGYGIRITAGTVTADSTAVDSIQRNADHTAWTATPVGSIYATEIQRHSTWAATGTLTPVAFENLTGKLGVQAYINKASELDLTKPVVLDGLTTIELLYL